MGNVEARRLRARIRAAFAQLSAAMINEDYLLTIDILDEIDGCSAQLREIAETF